MPLLRLQIMMKQVLHEKYYPPNYSGVIMIDKQAILRLETVDGEYTVSNYNNFKLIYNSYIIDRIIINSFKMYKCIHWETKEIIYIYAILKRNRVMRTLSFDISALHEITIGSYYNMSIQVKDYAFANSCIELIKENNSFIINKKDFKYPIYKNSKLTANHFVHTDVLQILALTIIIIDTTLIIYSDYIITTYLMPKVEQKINYSFPSFSHEFSLINWENQYSVELCFSQFKVDRKEPSFSYQHAFSAVIMILVSASVYVLSNKSTTMTTGVVTFTFFFSAFLTFLNQLCIPLGFYWFHKVKNRKKEQEMSSMLDNYLIQKENEVMKQLQKNKEQLEVAFPTLSTLLLSTHYIQHHIHLFPTHTTFLRVRIGSYVYKEKAEYEIKGFDTLSFQKSKVNNFLDKEYRIEDMILTVSFKDDFVFGIQLKSNINEGVCFIEGIIAKLVLFHTRKHIRLILFINDTYIKLFSKLKNFQHTFNDDYTYRFSGIEEAHYEELKIIIENIIATREQDRIIYPIYFLMIEYALLLKYFPLLLEDIMHLENIGFRIIILFKSNTSIPSLIKKYVIFEESSKYYNGQELIAFTPDESVSYQNLYTFINQNKPIFFHQKLIAIDTLFHPSISAFDIGSLWDKNKLVETLEIPIGMNKGGSIIYLDISEKGFGPHGLIAGTTGSGKSEWLLNFILLYAVYYSPSVLSFFIIDYKGGALANAFHKSTLVLPHIVGTLTNLDESKMLRSFKAIDGEIKRRFKIFKEVQMQFNLDSIDIYQYQRLYNQKKVIKSLPHLLIIVDEFAELKKELPEVMQQLISIARIGRSLGIHLILATQNPNGIVDEQIISNTRFRLCFKMQDSNDSMLMLQRDSAKDIKEVGEFYLVVGNHEYFLHGKGFYSRMSQSNKDKLLVACIDNIGKKSYVSTDNQDIEEETMFDILFRKVCFEARKIGFKQEYIALSPLSNQYILKNKVDIMHSVYIGVYEIVEERLQKDYLHNFQENGNIVIFGDENSGKTNMLSMLIKQLMTKREIVYCFDSEGGTLYKRYYPIVKNMYYLEKNDKVTATINYILSIMEDRKREQSNTRIHHPIFLIIHRMDLFLKQYEDSREAIMELMTIGKYFKIFMIASYLVPSSLEYRLQQGNITKLCLYMKDRHEYYYAYQRMIDIIPENKNGRGLLMINDRICQFQSYVDEQ